MKQAQTKNVKRTPRQETTEVLAHFFKESSAIIRKARKTARQKYPDLFTTPVK